MIAPMFRPYLDEALARFSYLHPHVTVAVTEDGVVLDGADPTVVAELRYTLYRQKIHRETDALRRSVIQRLLR
ncbi:MULTISPECIES: hypothetical protein [unclassified Rhizobium]|uniref:hypothetical protein n=1 Tax=unclassified Rhizobium TaxID=2613769 RepID=UPI001FCD1440|nr:MULTISPECIES: hypothetical protein [unclassified Rhizobium]MDM9623151.1 hypothetical protein [Rhizobium sp. S96]